MKVIIVGTDVTVLKKGSALQSRIIRYAQHVDELHIILFSKKGDGLKPTIYNLSPSVFVYPTESRNRWWYILDGIRVGERILKGANDGWVITCQDAAETGLVGWRLKRLFDVPLQLQIHTDIYSSLYVAHSLLNRTRTFFARFLLPRADCIRVVSERIKQSLIAHGISEEKTVVLPIFSPVSTALNVQPVKVPFGTTILMVDRLEKEKDVLTGIRAFAAMAKRHTDAGLVIVGDGSLRKDLELEAKCLDVGHKVVFVGWVDDVAQYYAAADIFLHTSVYEGYGLALIEAAAYKLPIVTTNVGIVGERIRPGQDALVCAPGDVSCLSGNLARFSESLELRRVYGESVKKIFDTVEKMTEDEYCEKVVQSWSSCGA